MRSAPRSPAPSALRVAARPLRQRLAKSHVIDLRLLREDLDRVKAAYARRGGVDGLDRVVQLDVTYRELLGEVEHLRAEQNRASKAIGQASPEDRPGAIAA